MGQKLGAPVAVVQPQIAVKMPGQYSGDQKPPMVDRKPSVESTQSDSKLVVRRAPNKASNPTDTLLGVNGTLKANNGAKTDRPAPVPAQKQPEKPKMERQFNRNITLNKSTNAFEKKLHTSRSGCNADGGRKRIDDFRIVNLMISWQKKMKFER